MTYEKQGFYSGQPLKASQLDLLEDGIILAQSTAQEAQEIAQAAAENAVAANMEKGAGDSATQQIPDNVADGFMLENNPFAAEFDEAMTSTIPYGATGKFSSSFGGKTSAQGKRAHAEGSGTIAKGGNAHSEGSGTVALGGSAHAEGYATTAAGVASHAEGGTTVTFAQNAHAEGLQTFAIGDHSHSEGQETVSSGTGAHAEGYTTMAGGEYAHSEGFETCADGTASHSAGCGTKANSDFSHASGYCTQTNRISQFVIGEYNEGKSNTLFEVGKGSDSHRENAFEVLETGDIGINYKGQMYSLYSILSDYFVDKNTFGFVSGDYSAKISIDNMNGAENSLADFVTKRAYKAGTTIEFKYFIEDPNYLIRYGTWFQVIHTSDPTEANIYDTKSWFGAVPTDSKGQWLTYSCTLPEDGYIYFGGEIGQWGAQYGSSNAGRGCMLIDNITITEDGISETDTFDDGLNSKLFNVNNRNAVTLGNGYVK